MSDEEDAWKRFRVLLEERSWHRYRASLIVVGLDPETTVIADGAHASRFIWLPKGLRPEWEKLTQEKLERRVFHAIQVANTIFEPMPSPMTSYAWFSEIMREREIPARWTFQESEESLERLRKLVQAELDKQRPKKHVNMSNRRKMSKQPEGGRVFEKAVVAPPIIPPWFDAARKKPGLRHLLPPQPATRLGSRWRKWDTLKIHVRRLWDAWVFCEASYKDESEFIRQSLRHEADPPNDSLVQGWMMEWRHQSLVAYGDLEVVASDGASELRSVRRGYGHPAFVAPVGRGARKK